MTEFEKVLQECLRDLEQDTSTIDECLMRHPKHAAQLRPLLLAGAYLERAREVPISEAFKARVRAKLMQEMSAHPRRPVRSSPILMRLAMGLMVALLALLATGTAYAQSALPGNAFYAWKLASEHAWRVVSADPLETDLQIAHRRADELIAVRDNPALFPGALKTYLETTTRLKSEVNVENETRILPLLDSQIRELSQSGITLPLSGKDVSPFSEPTVTPAASPSPVSSTPQPDATELLQATPASPAPSEIAPTVRPPSKIMPTLHSPPAVAPTVRSQIP